MADMDDYRRISVTKDMNNKLLIKNPTNFALIGQGSQGAIFKLDSNRCIKVYESKDIAKKEKEAYLKALKSPIMPLLYETGYKYTIIEYINGPNLKDYLLEKGKISNEIALELVNMFKEMNRLNFRRKDESLRHILLNENKRIKIVDHVYAFTLKNPLPIKLFRQLEKLDMLDQFIEQGFDLAPELFKRFKKEMPGFF
jgi:predicted Ser/Thr protein kinase